MLWELSNDINNFWLYKFYLFHFCLKNSRQSQLFSFKGTLVPLSSKNISLSPRKVLLKELDWNYHLAPFSLGFLFKEVDFWRRKILFSLRKLIFKKLGWGYHLIAFSLGSNFPKELTWRNCLYSTMPIVNYGWHFLRRIFKSENKVQVNKFGYFVPPMTKSCGCLTFWNGELYSHHEGQSMGISWSWFKPTSKVMLEHAGRKLSMKVGKCIIICARNSMHVWKESSSQKNMIIHFEVQALGPCKCFQLDQWQLMLECEGLNWIHVGDQPHAWA